MSTNVHNLLTEKGAINIYLHSVPQAGGQAVSSFNHQSMNQFGFTGQSNFEPAPQNHFGGQALPQPNFGMPQHGFGYQSAGDFTQGFTGQSNFDTHSQNEFTWPIARIQGWGDSKLEMLGKCIVLNRDFLNVPVSVFTNVCGKLEGVQNADSDWTKFNPVAFGVDPQSLEEYTSTYSLDGEVFIIKNNASLIRTLVEFAVELKNKYPKSRVFIEIEPGYFVEAEDNITAYELGIKCGDMTHDTIL